MNHVTDLDLENRSSWQGALDMVFALCGEAADLSFDCRMLGEDKTPTVEIRLDNPAELALPRTAEADGATVETWKYGTVVLAEERPAKLPEGPVFLLRRGGAAAVTYRAFKETVRVLMELGIPAEFSWSSIPLAPLCDDLSVTLRRERDSWQYGAVHTLWVRCAEDEPLRAAMRRMGPCGQLRAQNMATANTWVIGSVEQEKLLDGLKNA